MKTDGCVEKQERFSTHPCKTLLGFAQFSQARQRSPQTTKPDRSFATKTGHFYLLPTVQTYIPDCTGCIEKPGRA
jgi:hypothetical protein